MGKIDDIEAGLNAKMEELALQQNQFREESRMAEKGLRNEISGLASQIAILAQNFGHFTASIVDKGKDKTESSTVSETRGLLGTPPNQREVRPNQGLTHNLRYSFHDFPKFNGNDVKGWVKKSNRYFFINPIAEEYKVAIASINLEGVADKWFQKQYEETEGLSWINFTSDILIRFAQHEIEDVDGEFNRLHQTGTVLEYQVKFEELKPLVWAKHKGLTEGFFISSFVSKLKEEIRAMVYISYPQTLNQAISLAKLHENHWDLINKRSKWTPRTNSLLSPSSHSSQLTPNDTSHLSSANKPGQILTSNTTPETVLKDLNTNLRATSMPPIKSITHEEMQARRNKNLCYYCDETYHRGHVCKKKQLFMIVGEEECGMEEVVNCDEEPKGFSPSRKQDQFLIRDRYPQFQIDP